MADVNGTLYPLVIDGPAHASIRALRKYAEAPEHINVLNEVAEGTRPPPGCIRQHVVFLQFGFRVVYSVDQHESGTKWKHVSMSFPIEGKVPTPDALRAVAKELGMDLSACPKSDRVLMCLHEGVVHGIEQVEEAPDA